MKQDVGRFRKSPVFGRKNVSLFNKNIKSDTIVLLVRFLHLGY